MALVDRIVALVRKRKAELQASAYSPVVASFDQYNQNAGRWLAIEELEKDISRLLNEDGGSDG